MQSNISKHLFKLLYMYSGGHMSVLVHVYMRISLTANKSLSLHTEVLLHMGWHHPESCLA